MAPNAVITVLLPGQTEGGAADNDTVNVDTTEILTVCVPAQPLALVPVTVYVVELPGVAVTVAPVVALNPVEGVHEYVPPAPAPLAVIGTFPPGHMLGLGGVTVIVGVGLTVTTTVAVLLHPFISVSVTE